MLAVFVGLAPIVKGFADCPASRAICSTVVFAEALFAPKNPPHALFELKRLFVEAPVFVMLNGFLFAFGSAIKLKVIIL